jgi:integrase
MSVKVSFRKDRGRYQVEFYLEGKRKRPLFLTEQEAQSYARRISFGIKPEDRESITIEAAAKNYFERDSIKKHPKSRSNDRRYLNLLIYFMAEISNIERLVSIELSDMEAFRDWLGTNPMLDAAKGEAVNMGPSSINRCLRVMKRFFRRQIQWKELSSNPCEHLEFLDSDPVERAAMKGEQYLLTLSAAPAWFKPFIQFMYLTGQPAVCLERLEWADVDLVGRSYTVWRKKGARSRTKRTKLAMTDETFQLFTIIRNSSPYHTGPVFRNRKGSRALADWITEKGNDAIRAAGLSGVTQYGLRHALATDLTTANVATEIVRQAMGHQSISTTQKYANKVALKAISGAIESVRGGNTSPPAIPSGSTGAIGKEG